MKNYEVRILFRIVERGRNNELTMQVYFLVRAKNKEQAKQMAIEKYIEYIERTRYYDVVKAVIDASVRLIDSDVLIMREKQIED